MGCQGLASGQVDVLGQTHGQVLNGHGHHAAVFAVDGGDGVAPITLAADEPVAQAEVDLAVAAAHGAQLGDDGFLSLGVLATLHAGELAGLHQNALGGHGGVPIHGGHHALGLVLQLLIQGVVLGADDGDNGQVVLLGELEVTLVAAGNSHDGAGAVVGHDVVGHPHGNLLTVDGVHHVAASEGAVLFLVALSALNGGDLFGVLDDLQNGLFVFGACHQVAQDGGLGSQQEEAAAIQRVSAGGEHGEQLVFGGLGGHAAVGVAQGEGNLSAFGAANPVGLLLLDALGPAGELV